MLENIFSLTRHAVYFSLALFLLIPPALAQAAPTPPGQDPFGANGTSGLFEGYNADSPATSLFNGDSMKENGMFTTPLTQLGGATPYLELIKPERTNEGGPSFIVLTSKYTPQGDLTSASIITLTVTVKNVGEKIVRNIIFKAVLQDKNAALVAEPEPSPPMKEGSSIDSELIWDRLAGDQSFTLAPGAETDFSWSFKPNKDDTILRWRLTAEYGQGQSTLLQWIPIKNPNPQAGGGPGGGGGGGSYSNPCSSAGGSGPFPESSSPAEIIALFKKNWRINLVDGSYSYSDPQYKGILKAWWEALARVECTPFLQDGWITTHDLDIIASTEASGWGYFAGNFTQYMNLGNMVNMSGTALMQNMIHEMTHVWSRTEKNVAKGVDFENNISGHGSPNPYVSGYNGYNSPGDAPYEDLASAVGYYAIREQNEMRDGGFGPYCSTKNPYDWGQTIYYNWVKTNVFGGKEFGPPPPVPNGTC